MQNNRTFTIIKPDAVSKNLIGVILEIISGEDFRIAGLKMIRLTEENAKQFYAEHSDKPFFDSLVSFMISGAIVVAVLEKNNAVKDFRRLIGATDPSKAEDSTIRGCYAKSKEANAIHGSDCDESAAREIAFFFNNNELF